MEILFFFFSPDLAPLITIVEQKKLDYSIFGLTNE